MSKRAAASDVQKNFGAYHDQALTEPVRVTKYGRETVVIVSADMFDAMRHSLRQAIPVEALSDTEIALIEAAEIPEHLRWSIGEDR